MQQLKNWEKLLLKETGLQKLESLDLSIKREIIDNSEGVQAATKNPSLNKRLQLLKISKSAYYYKPIISFSKNTDKKFLDSIDKIHTDYPYYGTRRMKAELKKEALMLSKLIKKAFEFLNIKALYPKPKTTLINKEHNKYPYLLKEFKNDKNQVVIDKPNEVWSADITYIKLEKGFAYLSAIIDWHSKKVLSKKLKYNRYLFNNICFKRGACNVS